MKFAGRGENRNIIKNEVMEVAAGLDPPFNFFKHEARVKVKFDIFDFFLTMEIE